MSDKVSTRHAAIIALDIVGSTGAANQESKIWGSRLIEFVSSALEQAYGSADFDTRYTGDGAFVVIPAETDKTALLLGFYGALRRMLLDHNEKEDQAFAVKVVYHVGSVSTKRTTQHNQFTGHTAQHAIRLLRGPSPRRASAVLARTSPVSLTVSDRFLSEIIRPELPAYMADFHSYIAKVDGGDLHAWLYEPGISSRPAATRRPRIFIGTSGDLRPIAATLRSMLEASYDVTLWQNPFGDAGLSVEVLGGALGTHDAAVFLVPPDSGSTPPSEPGSTARDQLLFFLLGVASSQFGSERTFVLVPKGRAFPFPTDLLGLTYILYRPSPRNADQATIATNLRPAVDHIQHSLEPLLPLAFERQTVFRLETLTLSNFRNFANLELRFDTSSTLQGDWSCIAGINGAGKSSILQALCLVLLGPRFVAELGQERVLRMLRRTDAEVPEPAALRATLREGTRYHELYLPLNERGVNERLLRNDPEYHKMERLWERLERHLLVSYGASRNISEYRDTRYVNLSHEAQRQMTLFDPLSQIASIEVLLDGGEDSKPALQTLMQVLNVLFHDTPMLGEAFLDSQSKLRFRQHGTDLEVSDLPDGFRSLVAWLADLCASWHRLSDSDGLSNPTALEDIYGLVLIDEIDLHLHAQLQRLLVPKLRKALPNVQWVVSTHSPLILSSFDRGELILLDSSSSGGVRHLDRQILAFTSDQVYQWLMGTPPQSAALEDKLDSEEHDEAIALLLYQSEDESEEGARRRLRRTEDLISKMRQAKP